MTVGAKRIGQSLVALGAGVMLCGMTPGKMSVATFLARAAVLERLGPLALAAPDAQVLKSEVIRAGKRYKARIDADRKAGRRTMSCPPESGALTPDEWLAHLRSYPMGLRKTISIDTAFDGLMRKRYPCRT